MLPAEPIEDITGGHPVVTYDFRARLAVRPRILVLKLDHLGDFIIGLPSLRSLRAAFPAAHLHLVVGSWNRAAAEASGLVDEVGSYDFFPRDGRWDGNPHQPLERFLAVVTGRYDVAIDLRVDEDTRHLLERVDAGLRCGVGPRHRLPFLDVALPPEHEDRHDLSAPAPGGTTFGLERFQSRMPVQLPFHHETDFRRVSGHSLFGPHATLPVGRFRALFGLRMAGLALGLGGAKVTLDVARAGEIVALRRLSTPELRRLFDPAAGVHGTELGFDNDDKFAPHEFRIHIEGRPWQARLRFAGVRVEQVDAPIAPRFRRAELHTGEQLSLLVQLLVERTTELYGHVPRDRARGRRVVVAPLSNSDLRDWPAASYMALIRLLVDRLGCTVTLLGSRPQAAALEHIRTAAGRGQAVRNLGGETPWLDVPDILRQADLVVCNNSGVAHLAASVGAPTLAIYSGSHQPQEWGPRGERSRALMAVVPCSPCGYDRLIECPHDHSCMRGLLPETVFQHAAALLDDRDAGDVRPAP